MKFKLFVAALTVIVLGFTLTGPAEAITGSLPVDARQLKSAHVYPRPGMPGKPAPTGAIRQETLRLTFAEGPGTTIPFGPTTTFHIVEVNGLDGTYALVQTVSGETKCTIYVRQYSVKQVWWQVIDRHQPHAESTPVDVTPTEYIGY